MVGRVAKLSSFGKSDRLLRQPTPETDRERQPYSSIRETRRSLRAQSMVSSFAPSHLHAEVG